MTSKFKIPLQSEVEKYMAEKKNWPIEFVKYYADKFWNHYQASGWKLSSGNAIKDWKACFNSQWQFPKFKDDIEFLNRVTGKQVQERQANGLEAFYREYCLRAYMFKMEMLGKWFTEMKDGGMLKELSEEEKADLKQVYGNNGEKLRCAWVQKTFEYWRLVNYKFNRPNYLKAI